MYYILYKINGDVSGHFNEYYEVDSHHLELTQEIVDNASLGSSKIKLDSIKGGWVEMWLEDRQRWSMYDCVVFYDDKHIPKTQSNGVSFRDPDQGILDAIAAYKPLIREEKLNQILTKNPNKSGF